MVRPATKTELLDASKKQVDRLFKEIETLSADAKQGTFPFEDRDRNIRDVFIHLHEWHNMMETWYKIGMSGEKPAIPREGYTFKTLPALNFEIWKAYQDTDLECAERLLKESHLRMMELIRAHTDEELFTKRYYPWTNTTSLGSYFISSTSSHYDWAIKKIKKYKRELARLS
ncbi:ClbS/DfsB family four-helix bundle protein [Listeria aquatica]|uniref:ClbS/DfsB family four-helix bundle protein n=1 Tax=Listeria aquatica TaxID=1494960 RepID=A0A841ZKY2_9LIST|nr:ClbS/DfsB family four-helix bundle protein [Listeria aquatica]MBC1520157.1 ClbS/DfsB family four-helix bundle protein [Listeria aquatica]